MLRSVIVVLILTGVAAVENDTSSDGNCYFSSYSGAARCDYVQSDPDCWGQRLNYLKFYACADSENRPLIVIGFAFVIFFLFYLLGTTADRYFCPQIEEICDRLGLTPRVAGVTLLSLGNGASDIFSGIAAIRQNNLGLVIGQLTGGGMFDTAMVAGAVIFVSQGIRMRFPVIRDMMMYLAVLVVLAFLVWKGLLGLESSAIFLAYYAFFVGLAFWSDKRLLKRVTETSMRVLSQPAAPMIERGLSQSDLLNREYRLTRQARIGIGTVLDHLSYDSENRFRHNLVGYLASDFKALVAWCDAPFSLFRRITIVDCTPENWSVENNSRVKASIAMWGFPLLIGFWQDILSDQIVNGFPLWTLLLIIGLVPGGMFLAFSPTDHPPRYNLPFLFLGFVSAAFWVDIFANEMVDILTALGMILNVSDLTLGATILAWGNCVNDLTADVMLARNKREGMAITACFAGPLFNVLVVVGVGVLWASSTGAQLDQSLSKVSAISFLFLCVNLVFLITASFFFGKCTREKGNRLPPTFAYLTFALYAVFVIVLISMEAAGVSGG